MRNNINQGNFRPTEQRNPHEVWSDFKKYCQGGLLRLVYANVPSEKANRILKLHSNEAVAQWFASLTVLPITTKIDPLDYPIMGGPVGTPVYSYRFLYENRRFYTALFERLKNSQTQMVLKSLKLDGEADA
jgi:hypothetical protein